MSTIYPWGHSRRFNDYSTYVKNYFGDRVQKISVNVGFSCPNRDGSKGVGGCIYCDNQTFSPDYCHVKEDIGQQLQRGIDFFSHKYSGKGYIAYFQAYTNTYAPVEQLKQMYRDALSYPGVVGLIVGTRPDCFSPEIAEMLAELAQNSYIAVEFGLESTLNKTLLEINRCHTWEESKAAIEICHKYGIPSGGHLILGLPGEQQDDYLHHAKVVSGLPITTLKLHQLQIIKNTVLASRFEKNPDYILPFSLEEYIDTVISFMEHLNPEIVIERFVSVSPAQKVIAPKWGMVKNFEIVAMVEKEMANRDTRQGKKFVK